LIFNYWTNGEALQQTMDKFCDFPYLVEIASSGFAILAKTINRDYSAII